MTDTDLRELLRDRVADETTPDLSVGAWSRGRRQRRRRAAGVAAGVVAVTAVASVAFVVLDPTAPGPGPAEPTPPAGIPPPTTTPETDVRRDATFRGTPVWFSPDQAQERDLPLVDDGPLPPVIDLGTRAKALAGPAVAAFGEGASVELVDHDGNVVSVDITNLDDEVLKPNGYPLSPITQQMLAPDGAHLMFPQNGSVAVYDVATGEWTSLVTPDRFTLGATWVDADTIAIPRSEGRELLRIFVRDGVSLVERDLPPLRPPFATGPAQAHGPTVTSGASSARAWGMGVELPADDGTVTPPEFVVAETSGTVDVLSITWPVGDGTDGRWKQCCPVAGWLDDRTVVYESRQSQPTLVAWTVGTGEFRRLSTVEGGYLFASFADLGR